MLSRQQYYETNTFDFFLFLPVLFFYYLHSRAVSIGTWVHTYIACWHFRDTVSSNFASRFTFDFEESDYKSSRMHKTRLGEGERVRKSDLYRGALRPRAAFSIATYANFANNDRVQPGNVGTRLRDGPLSECCENKYEQTFVSELRSTYLPARIVQDFENENENDRKSVKIIIFFAWVIERKMKRIKKYKRSNLFYNRNRFDSVRLLRMHNGMRKKFFRNCRRNIILRALFLCNRKLGRVGIKGGEKTTYFECARRLAVRC